jgi:serine O-acetyltransferase
MASDFRVKEQLPQLTRRIVKTYGELGSINHLGHCPLPSFDVIASVIDDLREIIFPGYRRREGLHMGNIEYFVGNLIDSLHDRLTSQIARSLRHEARVQQRFECGEEVEDYEAKGQAMTVTFLESIPRLRQILANDVKAAYDGDPACRSQDEVVFCYPGSVWRTNCGGSMSPSFHGS